eukprot:gene3098-3875_t
MSSSNKIRVLVTGSSGLLGRGIMRVLTSESAKNSGIEVLGLAFSRYDTYKDQFPLRKFDLSNPTDQQLESLFDSFKPHILIHSAAERKPDICEQQKEKTKQFNVSVTEKLVEISKLKNVLFYLISTDYVFDGKNPPYFIDSECNPLSYYGTTKRESELVVLAGSKDNVVLRVPILYGQVENLKESAVTVIAEQVIAASKSQHPPAIEIDNWQIRYPTLVDDIGQLLLRMTITSSTNKGGIYQYSGKEEFTKYSMAVEMAKYLGIDPEFIKPSDKPLTGRPQNSKMDVSTTDIFFKNQEPTFTKFVPTGLNTFLAQLKK